MRAILTIPSIWALISPLVVSGAHADCKSVEGSQCQSSSLMQTGSMSSLLMKAQGSTVQQSLVSAEDFVTELAQRVVGHNVPLTIEENAALKTISDFIARLISTSVTQHAADQQTVDGARDLLKKCNTDATSALDGQVADYDESMQAARNDHSACRTIQAGDNGTRDESCQEYTQYRQLNTAAEPPDCMQNKHLAVGYVQTSNEEHQKLMEACLVETKPWLDPLYLKYKECKDDGTGLIDRKNLCDPMQSKLELAYCEFVDKHDDACSSLDDCMSRGQTNRLNVHASIKEAEGARVGDFSAAKHIDCLFGVFKAENEDKNSTFNLCKDKEYDVSHLKIVYHEDPDPVRCAKKASKPCAGTWVSSEYSTQLWHAKAPAAECSPCVTAAPSGAVIFDEDVDDHLAGGAGLVTAKDLVQKLWGQTVFASRMVTQNDNIIGFSFRASSAATHIKVGWTSNKLSSGKLVLDFAVFFRGHFRAWTPEVFESDRKKYRGNIKDNGDLNDLYSIKINSQGAVSYARNGEVYYTSLATVKYPWQVAIDVYEGDSNGPIVQDVTYITE